MQKENVLKRGLAMMLTVCMTIGIVPSANVATMVKAAESREGNNKKASVTAFATKEQLLSEFTIAEESGEGKRKGYLTLGKSGYNDIKWYIVGKDEKVAGDNLILFAEEPITTSTFEDEHYYAMTAKRYSSSWRCIYDEEPKEVDFNHYGASKVRATLQSIAADTNYFSLAEQSLMNETTITTTDLKNNNIKYRTSDKLYLPTIQVTGSESVSVNDSISKNEIRLNDSDNAICVGTDDDFTIAKENWGTGRFFWLRTPSVTEENGARNVIVGDGIESASVFDRSGVQPAVNLNMTSILFASAAKAADANRQTGIIDSQEGMKLRADGSKVMEAVCVRYGKRKLTYTAKAGDVVMVQGNDGTEDWYYSVYVDEDVAEAVITLEELKKALDKKNILLETSEVWIERTIIDSEKADCGMTYAVRADYVPDAKMTNVDVEGMKSVIGSAFEKFHTAQDVLDKETTELPKTIGVSVEDGSVTSMALTWELKETYNEVPGSENTYLWKISETEYKDKYDTNGQPLSGEVTICNAPAIPVRVVGINATVLYGEGSTIDVSKYFEVDANAGEKTYTLLSEEGTLSGTTLTFTKKGNYVVKLTTKAHGNYAASEATATITVKGGQIVVGTVSGFKGEYDRNSHTIAVSVTKPEGVRITYSQDGVNYSETKPTFVNAGTYTVYYKMEKENYETVTGSQIVEIIPKRLNIETFDQTFMWGQELDQTQYSVGEGLLSGDTLVEITLSQSDTMVTEDGTIGVESVTVLDSTQKDVSDNYQVVCDYGNLTILHNPLLPIEEITATIETEEYVVGDVINAEEICVEGSYEDGYTEEIFQFTTDIASLDMTVGGDKVITVYYLSNGEVLTAEIDIYVYQYRLDHIMAPLPIAGIPNGTPLDEEAMGLPTTIQIVTVGGAVMEAEVEWDLEEFEEGSYSPTLLTQQTFVLYGGVTLPEDVYDNEVELDTYLTVTVSEAHKVATPTVNVAPGAYVGSQEIVLTCATPGAVIYYTTDGSTPNGTSMVYGESITLSSLGERPTTTTIKAIAAKNGMFQSEEGSFTYVIGATIPAYPVVVTDGETSKEAYEEGEPVVVKANKASVGQQFVGWKVITGNITLKDDTSKEISFIMPKGTVEIKAIYEDIIKDVRTQPITKAIKKEYAKQMNQKLSVSIKGEMLTVKWGAVADAQGYDVFVENCGKPFQEAAASVQYKTKTKISVSQIDQTKQYKLKICAYRLQNGKKQYIANTKCLHIAGNENSKYTNAKKIKTKNAMYTLQEGSTAKIEAGIVKQDRKKELFPESHAASLTYTSSDEEVAIVSKRGKITAVKKGVCYITIRAANGVVQKVKVKVIEAVGE